MPSTLKWFRLYCHALCGFYALAAAAGIFFLVSPESIQGDPMLIRVIGLLLMLLGLVYGAATWLAPRMPRRRGGWNYGLIVLLLSFTSVIFLPLGVLLLIRWHRPEVRDFYGANLS